MADCTAAERETPEDLFEAVIASPDFGSTAAWAARSLLTFAVQGFPRMLRLWPCLRSYDYQSFVTPAGIVVVILRDTLNNVITGSPKAKRLDWSLSEALAPDSAGATLERLRERFDVRDDGAVFALPLRTAVSAAADVCRRWATADTEVLASQLAWNIERHERHLGLRGPDSRPTLNETDRAIAELVYEKGPLMAKGIVAAMERCHLIVTEQNVRRIFSEKLIPHYGFRNPRNRRGYQPPPDRTWA
jgi:hypothetical protein